jgi:tRNA uridine 5-carbamoylmethylation protein Kti12
MCGLPGSGKSTLANRFAKNYSEYGSSVVLSTDDYIELYAAESGQPYHEVYVEKATEAKLWMLLSLKVHLRRDVNIIVDRTHLTPGRRAEILEYIPSHYNKIACYTVVDKSKQKEWLATRPEKHIPDEVLADMRDKYRMPDFSEGFDELRCYNNGNAVACMTPSFISTGNLDGILGSKV